MTTMRDIAREAGVSQPTVSAVINNVGRDGKNSTVHISDSTRQRVLDAAKRLGYRRNEQALAMKTGKSRVIALIMGDVKRGMNYDNVMISGVLQEATKHEYAVQIYDYQDSAAQILDDITSRQIAGVVFRCSNATMISKVRSALIRKGIPFATADYSNDAPIGIGVSCDNFQGGHDATQHLIEQGYERIALVTNKLDHEYAVKRRQGYEVALEKLAPKAKSVIVELEAPFSPDNATILDETLSAPSNKRPDSAFCISDFYAMELFSAAYQRNLRVPDDIAICGFSDSDIALCAPTPLTSVRQPFHEMGKLAAERVIAAIEESDSYSKMNISLGVSLVVRNSTIKANK